MKLARLAVRAVGVVGLACLLLGGPGIDLGLVQVASGQPEPELLKSVIIDWELLLQIGFEKIPKPPFYYASVTGSESALFLHFQNRLDGSVYAIKFDSELNRLSLPFDILAGLDRIDPQAEESFPDNAFFFHEGFFYGVHQSFWTDETCRPGEGYFALYLTKYDAQFNLLKSTVVGYYKGFEAEPPEEAYDSPLVKAYGDRVYVINKLSGRVGTFFRQIGNVLRIYDTELNLLRRLELPAPPGSHPISTGDFVPCGEEICILEASDVGTEEDERAGRVYPTLALLRYDQEGKFIERRELIPEIALAQGDIRTLEDEAHHYVPFGIAENWDVGRKAKHAIITSLGIGVFDRSFELQRLIRVPPFQLEGYRRECCRSGPHVWIRGSALYVSTGISPEEEEGDGCLSIDDMIALQMFRVEW